MNNNSEEQAYHLLDKRYVRKRMDQKRTLDHGAV